MGCLGSMKSLSTFGNAEEAPRGLGYLIDRVGATERERESYTYSEGRFIVNFNQNIRFQLLS